MLLVVATHIQRFCPGLVGPRTYLDIVIRCMESSGDFSTLVLDIVSGFIHRGTATETWHHLGILY